MSESNDKTGAENLYDLRVNICKMTQAEFALAIGAKYQHIISEYESGVMRPGINRCAAIINLAAQFDHPIDLYWLRPDLASK